VKAYLKRSKNDANDAAAICEAVTRPVDAFCADQKRAATIRPDAASQPTATGPSANDGCRTRSAVTWPSSALSRQRAATAQPSCSRSLLTRRMVGYLAGIAPAIRSESAFRRSMMLALAAHVAQAYGGLRNAASARGGLAPWQARRACERLESDLTGKLTLEEIAADLGLSVSYCSRAFRTSVGLPHQWLLRQRVSAAKQLMAVHDLSLAEIRDAERLQRAEAPPKLLLNDHVGSASSATAVVTRYRLVIRSAHRHMLNLSAFGTLLKRNGIVSVPLNSKIRTIWQLSPTREARSQRRSLIGSEHAKQNFSKRKSSAPPRNSSSFVTCSCRHSFAFDDHGRSPANSS
jgi:AraC-like DNA-binding protein